MALILSQDIPGGFEAEYWVAEEHNDKTHNMTDIIMLLFKDADARAAGEPFVRREAFSVRMPGCWHTADEVYSFVKESRMDSEGVEQNKFTAAEDAL